MRKLLYLLIAAALCVPVGAQAWWKSIQQVAVSGAPPAYTGPGDVAGWSGAYGYWGLRAYNAAYAASLGPIVDLVDQAGANAITIHAKADGTMDLAAITAWVSAHSVTTIQVDKLYDQAGTQPLLSNTGVGFDFPQLVLNAVGGLPAIFFNNGRSPLLISASAATAQAQPVTVSSIMRFNTFTSGAASFTDGTAGFDPLFTVGAAGVTQAFGGSNAGYIGVADDSFASLQSVANGASSSMSVNGTITTAPVNPGSNGVGNTNKLTMGAIQDSGGAFMNGYIFEIIVKAGAVSTTNQGLMTANQRAIGTGF